MKKPILSILFSCALSAALAQYSFNTYDINPLGSSNPHDLVNYNGKLYFAATTPAAGDEPWVSDGTTAGTKQISDLAPGGPSSTPRNFFEINGKLLFFANPFLLYRTDGTTAGTIQLATVQATPSFASSPTIAKMGTKAYFAAGANANELWETDGTIDGTKKVTTFVLYNTGNSITAISACYGKLYISAAKSATERELWISDGTAAGTTLLKDINPGPIGSDPGMFTEYNNKVYFAALTNSSGREIWTTDGTATGTTQVTELGGSSSGVAAGYGFLKVYNNTLYFNGISSSNIFGLYKTNGTSAGTSMVHQLYNTPVGTNLIISCTEYKNKLYFAVQNIDSSGVWYTDGTTAGTANITSGIGINNLADMLKVYNNRLYFGAFNTTADYQMFNSDGNAASTKMLQPTAAFTNALKGQGVFRGFTESNGLLFFTAEYNASGSELWALKDSSLSIGNHLQLSSADITLYPNPAHHNFTIKTTTAFKAGSITLTDITGRVVMTEKLHNSEQTIALQGIAPGIYIADVWLDDKRSTQKLVTE